MNQAHQAQEQQQLRQQPSSPSYAPSLSEWYSNTTGMFMDKLSCFACVSSDNQVLNDSSDFEEFDGVYACDEQKEPIRKTFESFELSEEFEDNWIHHKDTLPMQNITRRTYSLLRSNSIFSRGDDDDDDAPREQPPTHSRENSCDSLVVLSLAAVHKPLHPPISPSDTNTTVSLNQSRDDDEEDWRSTTSKEVASHLLRPKRKHSSLSKSGGNKDHESYGCLLRMKPHNYTHGGDHADEMPDLQLLRSTVRPPCRRGNGRCLAAVAE
jgi:hypothetical protein